MSDGNCCAVCLRRYDFTTDGNGRLLPVHAIGKCVAPPPFVYALHEDEKPQRRCNLCKKRFDDERGSPYCSDRCADARRKYERDYAKTGKSDRCAICPYCEAAFWTRNPRQVTCLSDECKASHGRAVSLKWWYRCRRVA